MNMPNLDKMGNKEKKIGERTLSIKWSIRNQSRHPKSDEVIYEGSTSIEYKEKGKKKHKSFISRNAKKEIAWNNLINEIKNFLDKLK